jgi:hypothetical protein
VFSVHLVVGATRAPKYELVLTEEWPISRKWVHTPHFQARQTLEKAQNQLLENDAIEQQRHFE